MRSCASSGSLAASANAFSNSFVMDSISYPRADLTSSELSIVSSRRIADELHRSTDRGKGSAPLDQRHYGVVRVGGTRVTLDVIVHSFDAGASPEEIVQSFPTLRLADVFATIAFVLRHRSEVDASLTEQRVEADSIRQRIEDRYPTAELRRRLRTLKARA